MPFVPFAGIDSKDLNTLLYMLLKEQYSIESSTAVQSIQAGAANCGDAKLLQIETGSPVLCISRTTLNTYGQPFGNV